MTLDYFQIDAFASEVFRGNPAGTIVLDKWLDDDHMQKIAQENNLSETAFIVKELPGYRIRWFTPTAEVRLCGHATLASAHMFYQHLGYSSERIVFDSLSGPLSVSKISDGYEMNFPADNPMASDDPNGTIATALGVTPIDVRRGKDDFLARMQDQTQVDALQPDFDLIKSLGGRGLLVTAEGKDVDFVSRGFFPAYGINEDPVTGSAHTLLTPYWSEILGKSQLEAEQRSERGGSLTCILDHDRVKLRGQAATYLHGTIFV